MILPERVFGRSRRNLLAIFVIDNRVDAGHRGAGTSWLHRMEGRHRATEESTGLGLPPSIHDRGLAFPDRVVVPAPDLGLDGLPNGRHMLEMIEGRRLSAFRTRETRGDRAYRDTRVSQLLPGKDRGQSLQVDV